jgi:hypothetical protein
MHNDKLITTSGVIRNRGIARVGVISQHSLNSDFLDEIIRDGINISYEGFILDMQHDGKSEEEIEEACQFYESDNDQYLYGDWIRDKAGKYSIDRNGNHGFAVAYSGYNVCVEWSKTIKQTHHTSPCYVLANGDGPCGDLDTAGDSVIAYALPDDCLADRE